MAKIGRKTKRTDELQREILDSLKVGHIDKDACDLAGIHESTFYEWINTIPEFSEQVTKARLKAKDQSIKIVRKAALTDPHMATWWLTRRGGKEFKAESELPPINVTIENEVISPELQKSLDQAIRYAIPSNKRRDIPKKNKA